MSYDSEHRPGNAYEHFSTVARGVSSRSFRRWEEKERLGAESKNDSVRLVYTIRTRRICVWKKRTHVRAQPIVRVITDVFFFFFDYSRRRCRWKYSFPIKRNERPRPRGKISAKQTRTRRESGPHFKLRMPLPPPPSPPKHVQDKRYADTHRERNLMHLKSR